MDVQLVIYIGVGVVVLTLLVYLISVFGTREKTYEEIMEEQRKKLGVPVESDKKKEKKPKKGKKPKSEKPHAAPEEAAADEEEPAEEPATKMLNLELEPEIIEPDTHATKSTDVRKRKKAKSSILHNKDEKSPVSQEMEVEEKFHPVHTPKDDVEVKHERERRLSGARPDSGDFQQSPSPKSGKKNKKAKEVKPVERVVVEEVVQAQAAPVVHAEPPSKKSGGKKGNKSSPPPEAKTGDGGEGVEEGVARLASLVEGLSDTDIPKLVEMLLAKQGDSATVDWTKKSQKGDPMAVLEKQLQDTKRQLEEAHLQAESSNGAMRQAKQQAQDLVQKLGSKDKEVDALQNRMAMSAQQSMQDLDQLRGQLNRAAEEIKQIKTAKPQQVTVQQQSQGDSGHQQQLKIMGAEMAKNGAALADKDSKINLLQSSETSLKQQLQQTQEHLQQAQAVQAHAQQAPALKEAQQQMQHMHQAQAKNQQLQAQYQQAQAQFKEQGDKLKSANDDCTRANDNCTLYKGQLTDASYELSELKKTIRSEEEKTHQQCTIMDSRVMEVEQKLFDRESALGRLKEQISDAEKNNQKQMQQIKDLTQEKSQLESDLKKAVDQHQQQASAPQPQHQKLLETKEAEIRRLQSELGTQEEEITKIKDDLKTQQKKNNDATADLEGSLQSKQQEHDELITKHAAEHEQQTRMFQEQINQLQVQLSSAAAAATASEAAQPTLSDGELAQLKEKLEKLQSEVASKDSDLQAALSKATGLDEQLKNVKNELDTKSADVVTLEGRNKQNECEVVELRSNLTQSADDLATRKRELEEKMQQLSSIQEQLASALQQQNATGRQEGNNNNRPGDGDQGSMRKAEFEALQKQSPPEKDDASVDRAQRDVAQLQQDLARVTAELEERSLEMEKVKLESCHSKTNEAVYLREIEELRQSLSDQDVVKEMSVLKQKLAEKEVEVERLGAQLEAMHPSVEEGQTYVEKELEWKLEIEELQARVSCAETAAADEIQALNGRINDQAGHIESLKASLQEQSSAVSQLVSHGADDAKKFSSTYSPRSTAAGPGVDNELQLEQEQIIALQTELQHKQEEIKHVQMGEGYSPFSTAAGPGIDGALQLRIEELEALLGEQTQEIKKLQKQVSMTAEYSLISSASSFHEATETSLHEQNSSETHSISNVCYSPACIQTVARLQKELFETKESLNALTEMTREVASRSDADQFVAEKIEDSDARETANAMDSKPQSRHQTPYEIVETDALSESVANVLQRNADMLAMISPESEDSAGLLQITSGDDWREVSKPSADVEKQLTILQEQLDITRKENEELREKNSKTAATLAPVEQVTVVKSSGSDAELQSSNSKLLSQVQHYKTVLADTEGILNKLQTSVETEETKWHAKVRLYEQELGATKAELGKMKAERAGTAEKVQNGNGLGSSLDESDEAVSAATEAGSTL